MLKNFWEAFRAKFPPNRVAVALCAVLAGPLAIAGGDVAAWSATHFPGLHLTPVQVTGAFIAGVGAVALPLTTAAYKWFTGWIQQEGHQQVESKAAADHDRQMEVELTRAGHLTDHAQEIIAGPSTIPGAAPV